MARTPSTTAKPAADEPARVEGIFRSGSMTAIGVVLGFSLAFLVRWSGLPGRWETSDLFAVTAITLGVALQIKALVDLLAVKSVIVSNYERAVRIFVAGVVLVALGVVAAIFGHLFGYGGIALGG
ncbi:MAG: hypothetical protein ACREE0_10695 [Phenylobacterium sp.]